MSEENETKPISGTITPKIELEKEKEIDHTKLIWTDTTEQLLVRWGDHAACHQWLHFQSHNKYKNTNYSYSIPIIILSTITGTLNVGMNNVVPSDYMNWATIGVGVVNIVTGIITTLQNFFQYAQLSEAHFNSYVGWSKLSRNITIECSIDRKFRKDADRFISQCRADYDRLIEQSPVIPTEIISLFKSKFKKNKELILPDILDNLTHVSVYKEDIELFRPNPKELPEVSEVVLSEWPGKMSKTLGCNSDIHLSETPIGKFSTILGNINGKERKESISTEQQLRKRTIDNDIIKPPVHNNYLERTPAIVDVPNSIKVSDLIKRFGGRKDSIVKKEEEEIKKETIEEEKKEEEHIVIEIENQEKEKEEDKPKTEEKVNIDENLILGGSVALNTKPYLNRFSYIRGQNKFF